MHTVGVHHVCHDIGQDVNLWESFSANTESQQTLSVTHLTTLSQQMLVAVKHVDVDNFVFSRTVHWHIMHATQSNCRGAKLSTSLLLIMAFSLTAQQ